MKVFCEAKAEFLKMIQTIPGFKLSVFTVLGYWTPEGFEAINSKLSENSISSFFPNIEY
jgi:hypothetical protein